MTSLCACGPATRLLPRHGDLAATRQGSAARLRVYYSPSLRGLLPSDTVALYVELRNDSSHPLRVAYEDLSLKTNDGQRVAPLRPGDVFRPGRLPAGQRRLLASVDPRWLGGRDADLATPPWLHSMATGAEEEAAAFAAPAARYRVNGPWIGRNDLDTGPQLNRDGWPFFGLPPLSDGPALSLFDLLQATLPDSDLEPGAQSAGYLFFPSAAVASVAGMGWQVTEVSSRPREQLLVPVQPSR